MNTIFKFENLTIPKLNEQIDKRSGYYRQGDDNNYYVYLQELYKNSSDHASIIDNLVSRVVGTGFQANNELDNQRIEKYGLNDWLNKSAKNLVIYGGLSTEIIWNQLHEKITSFYPISLDRVRVGLIDEDLDEPTLYYYSTKFDNYTYLKRNKSIDILYKFDEDPKTDKHQLLYNFGFNRIGSDVYPRPDYAAAVPWVETSIQIPKYYMNLVYNNFMLSGILVVPFLPEQNDRDEFEKGLKEKFVGANNAASTMVVYVPSGSESEVKYIPVTDDQSQRKYDELLNLVTESLARAHRLSSPMLAGISLPGNLLGMSDLPTLEKMLNKNTIYPKRQLLIQEFNKINKWLVEPITNFEIKDINIFDEGQV